MIHTCTCIPLSSPLPLPSLPSILGNKRTVPVEGETKLLKLVQSITDSEATPIKQSSQSVTPPTRPLPPPTIPHVLIAIAETALNYYYHKVASICMKHLSLLEV